MRRLIIFLIRKKLGLKEYDDFRFVNQKSEAVYYFNERELVKIEYGLIAPSNVSLNWLLSDECKITRDFLKEEKKHG